MESQSHPREDHKPLPQRVHRGIEHLGSDSRKLLPEGSGELLESLGGRPVEDAEGLRGLCCIGLPCSMPRGETKGNPRGHAALHRQVRRTLVLTSMAHLIYFKCRECGEVFTRFEDHFSVIHFLTMEPHLCPRCFSRRTHPGGMGWIFRLIEWLRRNQSLY